MFQGGPVGVEAVAHTMNLAVDTLVDEVEPYLLRAGLVVRTPRGRKLTPAAYEHLGVAPGARSIRSARCSDQRRWRDSGRNAAFSRRWAADRTQARSRFPTGRSAKCLSKRALRRSKYSELLEQSVQTIV